MKERTLLKIASICSIIGVILLYFISENIVIDKIDVTAIEGEETGKTVKITGKIIKVSDSGEIIFLEIGQEKIETIPVVLFKDSDFELTEGQNVEIEGEIMDYEGGKEIIANRVRIT